VSVHFHNMHMQNMFLALTWSVKNGMSPIL
jgi:hypothetical protein